MKVGIVGMGWVGKAMLSVFPNAAQFDLGLGTKEEINKCDVAFICVPTPLKDGKLDCSISLGNYFSNL